MRQLLSHWPLTTVLLAPYWLIYALLVVNDGFLSWPVYAIWLVQAYDLYLNCPAASILCANFLLPYRVLS